MSHVRGEQYLPMADIYYSEAAVYSVGLGSAGTWLLLLSQPPPQPLQCLVPAPKFTEPHTDWTPVTPPAPSLLLLHLFTAQSSRAFWK